MRIVAGKSAISNEHLNENVERNEIALQAIGKGIDCDKAIRYR